MIYDGLDETADLLYAGAGNNGDLTDLVMYGTSPDRALTLEIVANETISCETQGFQQMTWAIDTTSAGFYVPPCVFLAIPTVEPSAFSLAPNPANDIVRLRVPANITSGSSMGIFDITGRVVKKARVAGNGSSEITIDTHDLEAGEYLVTINFRDRVSASRLTIAR